jgi:hypothetical protein
VNADCLGTREHGPSNGTAISVHALHGLVSNAGDLLDIARPGKSPSAAAGLTAKRQRSRGKEELGVRVPMRQLSAKTLNSWINVAAGGRGQQHGAAAPMDIGHDTFIE